MEPLPTRRLPEQGPREGRESHVREGEEILIGVTACRLRCVA